MISRRDFHRCLGGIVAACAVAPATGSARDRSPRRFIDVHTHLGQTWNIKQPLSAEELLRWMDAHEVAQAVVLPLVSPEASSYPLTSAFVLAETKKHRHRLVPFCSIDPRTSFSGGHRGLVDMLKRYIDAGAKGFGEHKPGVKIDSPQNLALFAACAEVELPVLLHLDNERNLDAPCLPGLATVLAATPDLAFMAHGPGWWASISGNVTQADLGGYPRGEVVPGSAIDALLDKFPNLYGDLSAGSGANAIRRDLKFGRDFLVRRADRLMFGTDFLSPGQDVPQFELMEQLDLPTEVQAKIFHENARHVLKLD
jgi:predicted TIM-barrel fold metal-dependent hydrolase